jgi:hypothetical protein
MKAQQTVSIYIAITLMLVLEQKRQFDRMPLENSAQLTTSLGTLP